MLKKHVKILKKRSTSRALPLMSQSTLIWLLELTKKRKSHATDRMIRLRRLIERVTELMKNKSSDMNRYLNFETSHTPYTHIWHKYRPAILQLMLNAENTPQQYIFSADEFRRIYPKKRGSLAFILYVHRSKALNNIKASPLAHALLAILQESRTAIRLTENSTYELMLDDEFVFHVRKNENMNVDAIATSSVSLEVEPAQGQGPRSKV